MEEEEVRGVVGILNNLTIETSETEEEAAELLKEALGMEIEDTSRGEVKEGGEVASSSLGAL